MRFFVVLSVLLTLAMPATAQIAAPQGRVIVTIAGDLPSGNLPARTEEDAGFFNFLDLTYDTAVGLDDAMLGGLEQHALTVPYGPYPELAFSGPRLSAVLTLAGAEGRTIQAVALDGYAAEVTWDTITEHEPILATHGADGPLAIGGYGPAAIVFPVAEGETLAEGLPSQQVWALIYISVE